MPKRSRKAPGVPVRGGWDVLPHNLGTMPTGGPVSGGPQSVPTATTDEAYTHTDKEALEEAPKASTIEAAREAGDEAPEDEPLAPSQDAELPVEGRRLRARKKTHITYTESLAVAIEDSPAPSTTPVPDIQQIGRQLRPRKSKVHVEEFTAVLAKSTSAVETSKSKGLATKGASKKRKRQHKQAGLVEDGEDLNHEAAPTSEPQPKKIKRKAKKTKDNPYGLTPGESPFPDWEGPSAEQCEEVYRLLAGMHDEVQAQAPEVIPAPSLEVTGCGEVPSVLDALIRTLLSGATTFANAAKMLQGLMKKYGVLEDGIGKGSIDWSKVRDSTVEEVTDAIRVGGLGNSKAKHIKAILDMVHQENAERREAYLTEKKTGIQAEVFGASEKTEGQKDLEILKAEQNILSLDHIRGLSADEAMRQFTKYPGVGVKTSACVILFCLQRPCFAVDTHVDKFSKWLKWAPEKATENDVFSHLEVRCPDHLKYGLHQLFIRHGQTCGKCKRSTAEGTNEWKTIICPLDHLLVRFDKRQTKAKPKPRKKKVQTVDAEMEIESQVEVGTELLDDGQGPVNEANLEGGIDEAIVVNAVVDTVVVETDDIVEDGANNEESELSELSEPEYEGSDYED